MILNIKFGQNPSFWLRDRVQTNFFWSKFDIQSAGVNLKKRSRSQKSNHFFPCPNGVSMQVWSKSTNWFRRQSADKAHFYSLYSVVTLKIRSRSPKSKQIFKPSKPYNIWSLAGFLHLVQATVCSQAVFGQNLKFSKSRCDLENEVKVTKI